MRSATICLISNPCLYLLPVALDSSSRNETQVALCPCFPSRHPPYDSSPLPEAFSTNFMRRGSTWMATDAPGQIEEVGWSQLIVTWPFALSWCRNELNKVAICAARRCISLYLPMYTACQCDLHRPVLRDDYCDPGECTDRPTCNALQVICFCNSSFLWSLQSEYRTNCVLRKQNIGCVPRRAQKAP